MPKFTTVVKDNEPGCRRIAVIVLLSLMTTVQRSENLRRLVIWSLVYLIPAYQAMLPIEDPDIWWHLRTGQWILEHGHVPAEDPFSSFGAGKPWVAYSWLFEILAYGLYSGFGLTSLVALTVIMSLAIAVTIHLLLRRARLPFVAEACALALSLASLKSLMSPRPWLFSIFFAGMELILIFNLRRSWKPSTVFLMAGLFVFWANLHIQFVYGLALVALLAAESLFQRIGRLRLPLANHDALPMSRTFMLLGICFLATWANPYHYRIYLPVLDYVTQTGAFQNISELQPMFFRSLGDWLVLSLTVIGAFALGWQRRWDIFNMALFVLAAYAAFRARRDGWFMVLAAAAIVSQLPALAKDDARFEFNRRRLFTVGMAVLLCLYGLSHIRHVSEDALAKIVESQFPAKAVEFVKSKGLHGPLFNHLDWGGYLIWSLPGLPVVMDGRTNLHGDERIARSLATWNGGIAWEKDPELLQARLIVAAREKPLTHLMRRHSRYQLLYEDQIAAVFVVNEAVR